MKPITVPSPAGIMEAEGNISCLWCKTLPEARETVPSCAGNIGAILKLDDEISVDSWPKRWVEEWT